MPCQRGEFLGYSTIESYCVPNDRLFSNFMPNSITGESYLNHPNFGLLYRICRLGDGSELYMTLYAHRLFFHVHYLAESLDVEPVSRNQARMLLEMHLRELRRLDKTQEYQKLQKVEKQM